MQKIDEFKYTCSKCGTQIILKASKISHATAEGCCSICNEPIGKELVRVKGIIDIHNSCYDELRELSNVEVIARTNN